MFILNQSQNKLNPALILGEIGLVRSLGEMGIPTIVGSEILHNPVLHSKYARNHIIFSSYESEKFIDELCEAGKKFKQKPVIFSDDDRAILNMSENRKRLEEFYLFLYPSQEMVNNILDKQRFNDIAQLYNLPLPASLQLASVNDFECVASQITYPCIIKPSQRHFWWGKEFEDAVGFYQKAIKCSNYQQFSTIYHNIAKVNPSVVVQEYVEGEDEQHYSANLFIDSEDALRGYYIARKLRIYPIKAGTGTYVVTVENSQILEISMDIIAKLKLRGLVNVQFKQDSRSGEYKLMEIHARNSLWSLLGAKSGANLAYIYYLYLIQSTAADAVAEARPNVKYFNLTKDVRAFFQYRAAGKLTVKQWLSSLRGERVFSAISFKDPLPILVQIWYILMTRIRKEPTKEENNVQVT